MHLVILSAPRTGSHMLRSMIKADPQIADIGAFLQPLEGLVETPPESDRESLRRFYIDQTLANRGRIVLSNLKVFGNNLDPLLAAMDTGGRFIHLTRRDRLAQVASFTLAAQHKAFYRPAPAGAKVTLDREQVAKQIVKLEMADVRFRAAICTVPHVELAYEDIAVETVSAAVKHLTGLDLGIGEPTTKKSAPPLAQYVTNITEF